MGHAAGIFFDSDANRLAISGLLSAPFLRECRRRTEARALPITTRSLRRRTRRRRPRRALRDDGRLLIEADGPAGQF